MSQNEDSGCGVLFAAGALLAFGAWYLNAKSDEPPSIIATPVDPVMTADNFLAPNQSERGPTAIEPVARPNWDFLEGQEYGYLAAVSEEDRKRGVAAGDVRLFRYAGKEDGKHVLISLNDNGVPFARSYCASPCVAIKTVYNDGSIRRLAYDTDSIIGAAFEDALAGRMKKYVSEGSAPRRTPDPVAVGPAPSEESEPEPINEDNRLD